MQIDNDPDDSVLQQGDRDDNWPKVQPYLIAVLTAKGTPLLSEGQEFCENYWVPRERVRPRDALPAGALELLLRQ